MFAKVGETLRRLRRERHLTLEELGDRAELGRGQLSRIETGQQQPTFGTLAKILSSQGVSRRDFFRRYDLVEAEATAVERGQASAAGEIAAAGAAGEAASEVREVMGRLESFIQSTLGRSQPVAQGAIEVGDYTVLFRVVPRSGVVAQPDEITSSPPPGPTLPGASSGRKRARSKRR